MLKKTITYTDYNDVKHTEDFYFNMTKAELAELELTCPGGFAKMVKKAADTQDTPTLFQIFKDLILRAYGEKSADGKQFVKNKELRDAFAQSEAYSDLFIELSTSADAASAFINAIVPAEARQANKMETKNNA